MNGLHTIAGAGSEVSTSKFYANAPKVLTMCTLGSDIIYFNGAGMEFVVLNSIEAIRDLLDKRSAIYSSR